MFATTHGIVWATVAAFLAYKCTTWTLVSTDRVNPSTHPLICSTHDVAGLIQSYLKKQTQLYYVSIMIAIALFYSKCDNSLGFPKSGHICIFIKLADIAIRAIGSNLRVVRPLTQNLMEFS